MAGLSCSVRVPVAGATRGRESKNSVMWHRSTSSNVEETRKQKAACRGKAAVIGKQRGGRIPPLPLHTSAADNGGAQLIIVARDDKKPACEKTGTGGHTRSPASRPEGEAREVAGRTWSIRRRLPSPGRMRSAPRFPTESKECGREGCGESSSKYVSKEE